MKLARDRQKVRARERERERERDFMATDYVKIQRAVLSYLAQYGWHLLEIRRAYAVYCKSHAAN